MIPLGWVLALLLLMTPGAPSHDGAFEHGAHGMCHPTARRTAPGAPAGHHGAQTKLAGCGEDGGWPTPCACGCDLGVCGPYCPRN
jgi:hypothetical protein